MSMQTAELYERLDERFPGALQLAEAERGQSWIEVTPSALPGLAKFLRDEPGLRFNTLMSLSGVHYPGEEELCAVYHLHSTTEGHTLVLKAKVPESDARIPSVERVWKTAGWHEREAWDLLGIRFEGHPDLRRILTPEDWEGHPLRKDYEQQESYQGITTRD